MEETFQNIKKITGISNVKQIVERIGNKDKDYNNCVAKVNDKEIKINILSNQIKKLNQDYIRLKNEASFDINEELKKTADGEDKYDDDEKQIIDREQELNNELEDLTNKNTNVELTYEKVLENIKFYVSKIEKLKKVSEIDLTKLEKKNNSEEEILQNYFKFLDLLKQSIDHSFSKVTYI